MTRKIVPFLVCVLWGAAALAGEFDKVQFRFANAPTGGAAAVSSSSGKVRGYIERLDLAFTLATNPVRVIIQSVNPDSGQTSTVYNAIRGTNAVFYPRISISDLAGVNADAFTNNPARILMLDDIVTMTVSNGVYPGQTVKGVIIYERP